MRVTRTTAVGLAMIIAFGVLAGSLEAAPAVQSKKAAAKTETKSSMPKEVMALIQEGLVTRQGRQDIPFDIFKSLVLPAQAGNLYPVFFFKAKNKDLGYAPSAAGSGDMESTLNVFFEFFEAGEGAAPKPIFGGRALAALRTAGAGYDPEKEDWYSLGLALPAGKYTMALVLTTPDMSKMSVGYHDITLPGPEIYQTALWPTKPGILMGLDQIDADTRPTVHRGHFTWGSVRFATNESGRIAAGDNLEVYFFVLGAAIKDPAAPRPANDLEVYFEIHDEAGEPAIKWTPQSYETYFINQPLPLLQTVQKLEDGKVVSEEKKALEAGKYTLVIAVEDKVSGKKGEARMPFEIQ